jgi:hypothetical protein
VSLEDAIADPLTGLVAAAAVIAQVGSDTMALLDVSLARTAAAFADEPDDPHRRAAPDGGAARRAPTHEVFRRQLVAVNVARSFA